MKIFLIAMLCLGVTHAALSTNDSIPLINFYIGGGGGTRIHGELGVLNVTCVKQGGWGMQIKTQSTGTVSKDLPSDYRCDKFFGGTTCSKEDLLIVTSFKLVKQFLSPYKSIRFGLEAGPSTVTNNIAQFKASSSSLLINGVSHVFNFYTTRFTKEQTFGFDLSAKVEVPLATFFGVELGITSNINKFKSFVGYEVIFNFGLVRNRSKKVK